MCGHKVVATENNLVRQQVCHRKCSCGSPEGRGFWFHHRGMIFGGTCSPTKRSCCLSVWQLRFRVRQGRVLESRTPGQLFSLGGWTEPKDTSMAVSQALLLKVVHGTGKMALVLSQKTLYQDVLCTHGIWVSPGSLPTPKRIWLHCRKGGEIVSPKAPLSNLPSPGLVSTQMETRKPLLAGQSRHSYYHRSGVGTGAWPAGSLLWLGTFPSVGFSGICS